MPRIVVMISIKKKKKNSDHHVVEESATTSSSTVDPCSGDSEKDDGSSEVDLDEMDQMEQELLRPFEAFVFPRLGQIADPLFHPNHVAACLRFQIGHGR